MIHKTFRISICIKLEHQSTLKYTDEHENNCESYFQ
jgi:hypothetical protein